MKKNVMFFILLLIVTLAGDRCTSPPPAPKVAALDQVAPPFTLSDLQGREVALSQFKGKVVILDFWATWCGPCRMSMPLLEKLQKEHSDKFTLLAINLQEPPELVRQYVQSQNIHSTVLLDSEGSVGQAYRSESIPMQVVIDRKGIVRNIHVGFSPRMAEQLRGEIEQLHAD